MYTTITHSLLPRYWTWINNILSASIYPVMAGYYIVSLVHGSPGHRELYSEVIVIAVIAMRFSNFAGYVLYHCLYTLTREHSID